MNKRLILLAAIAFVMVSESTLADDKTQPTEPKAAPIQGGFGSPGGWAEDKARRDAKQTDKPPITPEEKKAKRAAKQRQTDAIPVDTYGTVPMRTPNGTPLVDDFDEKGQSGKRGQTKALPPKGGFGPLGGREEKDFAKQRDDLQREQSRKAWDAKYGPEKAPGQ